MTLSLLISLLLLSSWHHVTEASIEHGRWDYETKGPATWAKNFPKYCSGRKQSPVNLSIAESVLDSTLTDFIFRESEASEFTLSLSNDGHKLQVIIGTDLMIKMGQGDTMYYTANQLHWHWGAIDSRGSEHTINGKSYPLEGHLVFYNSYEYDNFSIAVHRVGGLAVLGVFYELSTIDNPLLLKLEPYLPRLVNFSSSVDVKLPSSEINFLDAFLPYNRRHFYRYEGGLTTPTCNENVLWTVYKSLATVSSRQLNLLRSLRYPNGHPMVDNFRPPQPINSPHRPGANRLVYRSFDRRDRGKGETGFAAESGYTCGAVGLGGDASAMRKLAAILAPLVGLMIWNRF